VSGERRPPPVQRRTPGTGAATPRPAASLLLLRGGRDTLEVLLVRRNPEARFMGGVWVFPGGAVDPADGAVDEEDAHRAAAVRELSEEAGIEDLEASALIAYSRWITPEEVATRFDTRFYLAPAPEGARPRADGVECVDARWFAPREALGAYDRRELRLVFPTVKHLEQIAPFGSAGELLDSARGRTVEPVQPRLVGSGEHARIVLPGEPGY
jgi:8-oxo-dGTP pyrophosphatase MutT (NUDIX family)